MNHLHMNRNHRNEVAMIKQTVQYAFFLVVCVWLLYQIHHSLYVRRDSDCDNNIENRFTDEHIAKVLGRKGGASGSHYIEEVELYGVDLIGEAARMNNVTDRGADQSDKSSEEGDAVVESGDDGVTALDREMPGEIAVKTVTVDDKSDDQGEESDKPEHEEVEESVTEMVDNSVNQNVSVGDGGDQMLVSEKRGIEDDGISKMDVSQEEEIESVVKLNAVVLKKDEKLEVFRFSDENGVPEHESGPSRRSDVEVKTARKGSISKAGNQTKALEPCQDVCPQNATEKRDSIKSEKESVDREIADMVVVKHAKGSMRDLLSSER